MRINLRGGNALVPQQFLHVADVESSFQPLGGAGVAQHVWGEGFVDSLVGGELVQRGAHARWGVRCSLGLASCNDSQVDIEVCYD